VSRLVHQATLVVIWGNTLLNILASQHIIKKISNADWKIIKEKFEKKIKLLKREDSMVWGSTNLNKCGAKLPCSIYIDLP
jgi:hypothetical protein